MKVSGPRYHEVQVKVAKDGAHIINPIILHTMNLLQSGVFPDKLKITKMILILKNRLRTLVENYRPVSISYAFYVCIFQFSNPNVITFTHVSFTHNINTRNHNNLRPCRPTNESRKTFISYYGCILCNELDSTIRSLNNFVTFKIKTKKIYYRMLRINLYQLYMYNNK